jgi:3-oxoacyl-[acyl-carrier protein] reductase
MSNENQFKDKVVLVTGAGRGIGKALAIGFARVGAKVACLARSSDEILRVVEEIHSLKGVGLAVKCDVTDLASIEQATKEVFDCFGGLDIVFVNAGVNSIRALVGDDDPDLWRQTIEVNLIGAYYTIRSCIPYLKKSGGGRIISIGSGRGRRGDILGTSYACSKAGLWMLVRTVAEELRPFNITVNELIPGPVITEMNKKFNENIDAIFTDGIEWIKQPDDILPLAFFIASQPLNGPTAQSFSLARREL